MNQQLSPSQLRAARALLNWSRADLAAQTNISEPTIHRIENDLNKPNKRTQSKLCSVLEQVGIEFTDNEGVRRQKNQVRIFTGKTEYKQFLDHIYLALRDSGGKIRQFNSSDAKNLAYADDYANIHLERMGKIRNLDARVLTVEGDHHFPASYCVYRWLQKASKILIPYYVYGDYLAMPIYKTHNNVEIVSIHSKLLSERYTEQFELFWETALVPNKNRG